MSIEHTAKLVYGVLLTPQEHNKLMNLSNDDFELMIIKDLLHTADRYSGFHPDETIVGVCCAASLAGESMEIRDEIPSEKMMDEMLDALDSIGVDREPTWYLICEVS